MREESQIEEMRSALRGDFERLAERRGDQKLMLVPEERGDAEPAPAELEEEPRRQRSWLARLISP